MHPKFLSNSIINNKKIQKNINLLNIQIKNFNLFINNAISEVKNVEKHINNLFNFNQDNTKMKINNINIIEGILDINTEDIQNGIILFNSEKIDGIDTYINNKKINLINENNKWKIFENIQKGKNKFKIIFNNSLTTLFRFFNECTSLFSIDLSNLDTSNVIDFGFIFNGCNKLKEIKGLNNLNTSKVNNMKSLFQDCNELEYLDLSNFDTSNVIDMSGMFNLCYKLKEIKGINILNTNNVIYMNLMFQCCHSLEYLDLSNFNTSKVTNMGYMFNNCYKLKKIKGINKFIQMKLQIWLQCLEDVMNLNIEIYIISLHMRLCFFHI